MEGDRRLAQRSRLRLRREAEPYTTADSGRDQKKTNNRDVGRENDMGRMMEQRDWDHRKEGRDWRMRPDD